MCLLLDNLPVFETQGTFLALFFDMQGPPLFSVVLI